MRNNLLLILSLKKELDLLSKRFQGQYNIYTAANSAEALHHLETVSIQLIICSVNIPVMNGWELCRKLKSTVHFSHIPLILLTADDSLHSKIKNLEAGADAYVSRPLSLVYLEAQITNLLANRAKITAHFAHSDIEKTTLKDATFEGELFIEKLHDHIYNNVHNNSLNVGLLARFMNMSRPTFYRKIKSITSLTPNDLISQARLKRAAGLLESADYKVNEIARMTGFLSQSSFGKAFTKEFKVTPTEYRRMKKKTRWQNSTAIQEKYFRNIKTPVYTY